MELFGLEFYVVGSHWLLWVVMMGCIGLGIILGNGVRLGKNGITGAMTLITFQAAGFVGLMIWTARQRLGLLNLPPSADDSLIYNFWAVVFWLSFSVVLSGGWLAYRIIKPGRVRVRHFPDG